MDTINPDKNDFSELRKKAKKKLPPLKKEINIENSRELIEELRIHEVELEMQNDELRSTQLKLLNSVENYTELFENAPVGYFILDSNGIIINVNNRGCLLLDTDKNKLIGKHLSIFLYSEQCQDHFYRHCNLVMETSKSDQMECLAKKKDGSNYPAIIESSIVKDEKGNFKHLISIITDISLRKTTENLLGKNQRLLQSIFNNTNTVIIIKDLKGHYLMVNKQFEKIHNIPIDKIIGKTVYDIVPVELADIITKNDKNTIESGKLSDLEELVIHKADGTLHTYLSVKFPIVDDNNKVYSICNIATDISEKKKHKNELLEAKARLEATLENAISSIWSIDKNYKLSSYNKLCEKTFENINHVTISIGISMLNHLNSEEQIKWKALYDRAFNGEHFSEELTENFGDKVHYFDTSFNPIRLHGKVEGVSVFAGDITSRKKTEQQLNYKVNELNTFMYKATHDLRSPLASLTGLIKLAKDIAEQPVLKSYFDMIDTSINRMDKLLIDLFNIVNVTQGKLNISIVDFETMVDEIIDSLSNRPSFSKIIFRKKIVMDTLFFQTDSRLLYSVLQNIIDNAIKYKRESNLVEPIILITITITNHVARISVSDNGIGIPAELQNKVFDMFFRAASGTNGTGLGLYIVKSTVEKLGGDVRIKSEENHGTSVFITLPNLIE